MEVNKHATEEEHLLCILLAKIGSGWLQVRLSGQRSSLRREGRFTDLVNAKQIC